MTRIAFLRLLGFLAITLLLNPSPLVAETDVPVVPVYWMHQFGGYSYTPADVRGNGIAAVGSANGEIYVVGIAAGALPGQAWIGYDDAYIRKYNSNGEEVWTRQFGIDFFDWALDVAVDTSGVYVVGDSGATTSTAFLAKFDADGNEVWKHYFGQGVSSRAGSVIVHSDAIYMAGYTWSALPGQTHAGGTDAYIRKCDKDGNELWVRQFGTSGDDFVSLFADGSDLYAVGQVNGALPNQTAQGGSDAYIRKYDGDGNEIWTYQFGTPLNDSGSAIVGDASGLYIAGSTTGTLPGQTQVGGSDAFIRKYSFEGAELWTRQYGTTGADGASQIVVDSNGLYVAGFVNAALPAQTHFGAWDGYVRKYDLNGNEIWTKQFGSDADDWIGGLEVVDSAIYLSGTTIGTLPGQTGTGKYNAYIMQLGSDGSNGWLHQYGADEVKRANTSGRYVLVQNGLYVAGTTEATLPGQTSAGSSDVYIRHYSLDGNPLWTRQFGSNGMDILIGAAADGTNVYVSYTEQQKHSVGKYANDGSEVWTRQFDSMMRDIAVHNAAVYIVGNTYGTESPTVHFVTKLDADGNQGWTHTLPEQGFAIAVDASAIYIAGHLSSTTTYLRKLDFDGNELWTQTFTTSSSHRVDDMVVNANGIYMAGSMWTPENPLTGYLRRVDSNGNELWLRNHPYSIPATVGADDTHAYVSWNSSGSQIRKYDLAGNEVWTAQIVTPQSCGVLGIALDDAYVYITGSIGVTGSTNRALTDQALAWSSDAFVAKISKDSVNVEPVLYLPVISKSQ